ncbi:hypothetical protein A374_06476 [Fictibacillus macauensis ZFHKF-1]|uniref:Sulfate exporter family transporter n=1 Tax=Fictibacillus macauensis ZFHKF-1 TaxID=1196324 RepID=I8UHC0_9BACL|nr:putative sulfate exporter family transporter [Fictibacillus macauensis]EIT86223.1 hypothetical protein A374_06476 [Fictibacillus macauensis ZFHKF-1]
MNPNTASAKQAPAPKPRLISGVFFTFCIALLGMALSYVPYIGKIGALALAILLAVLYRQFAGYPETLRTGIEFSGKKLLRFAIILYGFKLNMAIVFSEGLPLLARGAGTIVFSLLITYVMARLLKADRQVSFLVAIGTGICGAAAIAAVSPIVSAKEEDTALSVGMIALMGTIFSVAYTIVFPFLPLSPTAYGIWSGLSLHELAHVALAGAPAGSNALALALLAKLCRVFLLVPFCLILIYIQKKRAPKTASTSSVPFPWFLVGFMATSVVASYVITLPATLLEGLSIITTFLLTMAMTGLGLNVSLAAIKQRALRPLLALLITSLLLSSVTYFL